MADKASNTKKKTNDQSPFSTPPEPKAQDLKNSYSILKYANDSTTSFFNAFEKLRTGAGAPKDTEQDLLRAMLVFSAAGLDSLLKQIVRDGLPVLLKRNEKAQEELFKFAQRSIRGAKGDEETEQERFGTDHKFLANVLLAESPRQAIIENLISTLIGESLQSTEQILKVVSCLGLDPKNLGLDKKEMKDNLNKIFKYRNQIVHEMDIELSRPGRKRIARNKNAMKKHAQTLLDLAATILEQVDSKLSQKKKS